MAKINSFDLSDFGIIQPPKAFKPRRRGQDVEPIISTDWDWMLSEAAIGGCNVQNRLKEWEKRRRAITPGEWPNLRETMGSFVHRRLFTVTLAEIEDVIDRTCPPLGGTRGVDREFAGIHDSTSPAPLNLTLNGLLERSGIMPTFQDLEARIRSRPGILLDFISRKTGIPLEKFHGDWLKFDAGRALRYRLGTAYNSFIREVHVRSSLAERHGVFLSHHFLLDAEFKIDFSYGDIAIELYLKNSRYKDEDEGRKERCFDVNPGRDVEVVSFDVRRSRKEYDTPWLITDADILRTAERLLSGEVTHPRKPAF
jgi:hypothetical protein